MSDEVEITPEMIAAGADVILGEFGGSDLLVSVSPRDLAVAVYSAMRTVQVVAVSKDTSHRRTC